MRAQTEAPARLRDQMSHECTRSSLSSAALAGPAGPGTHAVTWYRVKRQEAEGDEQAMTLVGPVPHASVVQPGIITYR